MKVNPKKAWIVLAGFFAVSFIISTITIVWAKNQWYIWHWGKKTVSVTVAPDGYWGTIISSEFNDWDNGTCVDFTVGGEITGDAKFFGTTGWLGLARLLDYDSSTGEIFQAEALMNRSYLDGSSYDETDDRHVTCQEIGHTIGLDHRKGPRNQTCMNDMFLGWDFFNQHDADTVAAITVGCDGGSEETTGTKEKGRKKCTDGVDNDLDGLTDSDDPDCQ